MTDAQWTNRFAVLAGTMPAWAEPNAEAGPVRECVAAVLVGQDAAVEAVAAWKEASRKGIDFEKQRRTNGGLMQLVLRLWRERVEHDAPGLSTSEARWVVREQRPRHHQQQRRSTRNGKRPASEPTRDTVEQRFAACLASSGAWGELRERFKWSPWFPGGVAPLPAPAGEEPDGEDEGEDGEEAGSYRRWRLQGQCLRVASYYRVMRCHGRATERERLRVARGRFQWWAASYLRHVKEERGARAADAAADAERRRRGELASANTRMARMPARVYRSGVRTYTPRAAQHVIDRRLLGTAPRRTQITSAAEIGPRLHELFGEVATRCVAERTGDG